MVLESDCRLWWIFRSSEQVHDFLRELTRTTRVVLSRAEHIGHPSVDVQDRSDTRESSVNQFVFDRIN
jgi:hypothetical protein